MALREISDTGEIYDVSELPHRGEFNAVWNRIEFANRGAMGQEINRRLDLLISSPDPNWGSITNTSIEGGRVNPVTGIHGDWRDTPFHAIYEAFAGWEQDEQEERAGMFYGNLWKKLIIERPELWIGYRADPTFPQRGITLGGKTYFLAR